MGPTQSRARQPLSTAPAALLGQAGPVCHCMRRPLCLLDTVTLAVLVSKACPSACPPACPPACPACLSPCPACWPAPAGRAAFQATQAASPHQAPPGPQCCPLPWRSAGGRPSTPLMRGGPASGASQVGGLGPGCATLWARYTAAPTGSLPQAPTFAVVLVLLSACLLCGSRHCARRQQQCSSA